VEVIEVLKLVPRDRAIHSAEQQVELAVAIDVGELGDVLAIGVYHGALHVLQRIGGNDEPRRVARTGVAIVTDVAERRLGEEIVQAVAIHIHESVPLADVDALKAVSRQPPAVSGALKKVELSGVLLNE
jgi:hypothetical protein